MKKLSAFSCCGAVHVFGRGGMITRRRVMAFALAALCVLVVFVFFPLAVSGEEDGSEADDLLGNAEETLDALDLSALQEYLDSLSEQQKALFGADVHDKILSVISGDFA